MFIRHLALACCVFVSLLPVHGQTVTLPGYGFSMDLLDGKATADVMVLTTHLPVTEGFSPNVNVVIQNFPGTRDDYIKVSKNGFEQMKLTLLSEEKGTDWRCEYQGEMQGRPLRFYSRAVPASGRVYLLTATATESQWATHGQELRRVVDSFSLK